MKIIIITTQNTMFVREIPENDILGGLQDAVGGHVQTVPTDLLSQEYALLCNEDSWMENLEVNPTGCKIYGTDRHGYPVLGDIAIVGIGVRGGEPDFVGLEDSDIETLMDNIWTMMGGSVEQIEDPEA